MPKVYNLVYYVDAPEIAYVNPIAIRPEIHEDMVLWEDTGRGKIVYLGEIKNIHKLSNGPPETLEITSREGRKYLLKKLTLEIYNKNVRDKVALQKTFPSDEALQNFYLSSNFGAY